MSELHLSLIIIGAIFIVAVFLFNRWQERKFRKQAEKMFRTERQDVLFEGPTKQTPVQRIEPSLGEAAPMVADEPSMATLHMSSAGGVAVAAQSYQAAQHTAINEAPVELTASTVSIDEAIDLIGVLHTRKPISAEHIKNLIDRAHTFAKPVQWEGLVAGQWVEISSGRQYNDLRIAMQLADRRGPATSADISGFIGLIKQFAVELDASVQAETEESAAARATDLDGFCADVDVEIGVNVVAGAQPITATKLRALAESSGLTLNPDGVFYFQDGAGSVLFTLRNSEPRPFLPEHIKNITTRGITFLLDVPRVTHGGQVFAQILTLGQQFAEAFGGALVDDNGKPLTDTGADSIGKQLSLIYREMDGYGIAAGSTLAQRLFS